MRTEKKFEGGNNHREGESTGNWKGCTYWALINGPETGYWEFALATDSVMDPIFFPGFIFNLISDPMIWIRAIYEKYI